MKKKKKTETSTTEQIFYHDFQKFFENSNLKRKDIKERTKNSQI